MSNNQCLCLSNRLKDNINSYSVVFTLLFFILLMSNSAHANFASNETSANGMCPVNHKMYYIGANPPASTSTFPVASQALSWTAGSTARTFTFTESSGNKIFRITFSNILDKTTTSTSVPSNAETPFYDSLSGVSTSAINLLHSSPVSTISKTNHSMGIAVNRSTSKSGYKIQDVDSVTTNNATPYIEQVDVSANSGRLTHNSNFHTINAAGNIVTGRRGLNCGAGACTIDANWNYTLADIALNLRHNNVLSELNSPHAVGYSDFYFCLAPPKLIIKKALNGNRVNDSDTKRDQFELTATGGSIATNSFTTTGTGSTITNGTSATLSLAENTSYIITERAMNGTSLGNIADYDATYTCTNATTGSTTVMPTAAMTYNATANTRSFTLANATYGDEITCTITNTPKSYTFSGIVFNDNGGIIANNNTRQDISSTFTGNSSYFNGIYDSGSELGIYDSNLNIRLTDCNGNNIVTPSSNPQTVSNLSTSIGRYSFVVAASALVNRTRVCVIENEPSVWDYTVDTTADSREIALTANVYDYSNLNFGEIKANNSALVLIKSQYVHECNDNLNYQSISRNSADPTIGFSVNSISGISPGKCVAYAVQAYNRGHIGLQQVQIRDQLQTTPVTSVFRLPAPLFIPTSVGSPSVNYGSNGEIRSNQFGLAAVPSGSTQPSSATLYFNTKYGQTQ
ncbi:hypothetical protein [Psychrobacter aquaticus]|uniref:SpaA-like prealbumin fold domain-containing protein n=2 Tax=Psychrobacter TaxID=497 RepID=U4T1W4_9GAMM|nr:hypothetical protein [Psychrobacter aquaticus]ERL54832.1 hypothetical protein M917_2178 [Psychrobacter aquaticus CMS 56]